jgi:pilus assembly protein CpaB
VVGVHRYIRKEREKDTAGMKPVAVIAAAKRIKAGTPVTRAMLTQKMVPERDLPDEAIEIAAVGRLVGRELRRNLDRGKVLQWDYFDTPRPEDTRVLLPGERAVAMPVDTVSGVAGLIQPNSRIDIYGTFSLESKERKGAMERRTVLLLSDVIVLAIDNITHSAQTRAYGRERRKQGYSSLTLALTPEESALLIFAQGSGDLHCALRQMADVGAIAEPIEVDLKNFLDLAKQANQKRVKQPEAEDETETEDEPDVDRPEPAERP